MSIFSHLGPSDQVAIAVMWRPSVGSSGRRVVGSSGRPWTIFQFWVEILHIVQWINSKLGIVIYLVNTYLHTKNQVCRIFFQFLVNF